MYTSIRNLSILVLSSLLCFGWVQEKESTHILFEDDFSALPSGRISSDHGAHTEYHFTEACHPIGDWQVSSFDHDRESQMAWKAFTHQGERVLAQTVHYPKRFTHPMMVAGDSLWQDYQVDLRLSAPDTAQTGICVRYKIADVTILLDYTWVRSSLKR